MKINLIMPQINNDMNFFTKGSVGFTIPPYGLQLIAAVTPKEHEVRIIDETIGQVIDFEEKVDLVGISVMTPAAPRAYQIADEYRKRNVKVVLGGYHVSILPQEAIEHCDAVCIGEGERLWRDQILQDAQNNNLKQFYETDTLFDLKDLPYPRRELSPKKGYMPGTPIMTSRGCPFKCEFCATRKFFGDFYRFRPVEDVINEVKYLKANKMLRSNFVFFLDDNIIGNKQRAKELFKALIPLKIKWASLASTNIVDDEELIYLAKESGCMMLQFGFESVSNYSLNLVNKKHGNIDKYVELIKKFHEYKIAVHGYFVLGFDGDGKNIFEDTIKFIEDNNLESFNIFLLTPLPGTVIYDNCEKEGRMLTKQWNYFDMHHTLFTPKLMTAEELHNGFIYTCKKLCSFKSIFKRVFGAKHHIFISLVVNLADKILYTKLPKKPTIAI